LQKIALVNNKFAEKAIRPTKRELDGACNNTLPEKMTPPELRIITNVCP